MNIIKSMTILGITTSLLLAAPHNKKDTNLKQVMQIGKKSSKLLIQTLGKNMKKNVKAGGSMKALDFCSQEAYNLTEKVNKRLPKGVYVKRISLKYRNPANKPKSDEAAVLQALAQLKNTHVLLPKYIVEKVDAHTYKYYKPLIINKRVCLKCHGDVQNTALRDAIKERYPQDKATRYKMGDLRGAVVVIIKK